LHPVASVSITFRGAVNRNNISDCFYFLICFCPYGPSSGGIYTSLSLEAIVPTTDPLILLGYTIDIYWFLFLVIPPLSVHTQPH
jgi:hypothetical protein